LGHFQLTARLWPALKKAGGARVVSVSSFGHHLSPFDFEDPNFEHRAYESLQAYGQSKTANNLFAVELDHRGKNSGVRAYSLHPGSIKDTELGRSASGETFRQLGLLDENGNLVPAIAGKLKTPAQGAATTVWCATSPQLENIGGVYCENAEVAWPDRNIDHQLTEPLSLCDVMPYSVDAANAQRLWALSEKLTGVRFAAD
jgi:NAD(P)-dependent dehydrogenase (short-subunit alcohol dehydrogenase family)